MLSCNYTEYKIGYFGIFFFVCWNKFTLFETMETWWCWWWCWIRNWEKHCLEKIFQIQFKRWTILTNVCIRIIWPNFQSHNQGISFSIWFCIQIGYFRPIGPYSTTHIGIEKIIQCYFVKWTYKQKHNCTKKIVSQI